MTLEFFTWNAAYIQKCIIVICISVHLMYVLLFCLLHNAVFWKIFNWRVIALHYRVSFCCPSTWSSIGIHMSPPSWTSLPSPYYPSFEDNALEATAVRRGDTHGSMNVCSSGMFWSSSAKGWKLKTQIIEIK